MTEWAKLISTVVLGQHEETNKALTFFNGILTLIVGLLSGILLCSCVFGWPLLPLWKPPQHLLSAPVRPGIARHPTDTTTLTSHDFRC